MFVRTLCILLLIATPSWAQLFGPKKPKVVATPAPKPTVVAPAPAPASKPAAKRRAPAKAADPLVAYMPTVKAAFSARWADEITPLLKDFNPGALNAVFKLDAEGKVTDFSVNQNTSNEAFAKFCEKFVRETTFEKPPEKALKEGVAEIPFTFSIY